MMIICLILICNRSETIYQEYLEKNAILEDRKRKIMAAIAEKQEELIVCPLTSRIHQSLISNHIDNILQPLAVKRHQAIISLGHEVENGQLEGMALIKGTCQRM